MVSTIEAPKTLNELVTYQEYTITADSSVSAGTIGTRAFQKRIELNYIPKSIEFVYIGDSSSLHHTAFLNSVNETASTCQLIVNGYRATASAISQSGTEATVRCYY